MQDIYIVSSDSLWDKSFCLPNDLLAARKAVPCRPGSVYNSKNLTLPVMLNLFQLFSKKMLEEKLLEVLKLAKVKADVEYLDPKKVVSGVYDVYLNIRNPFNTNNIDEQFISDLEEASKTAKEYEGNVSDMWDKLLRAFRNSKVLVGY